MDDKTINFGILKLWDHDNIHDYSHLTKYYKKKIKYSASIKPIDALKPVKLNRHPFLYILAKAYVYSGEEKYAEKAFSLIKDWIDKNPVGIGLGWCDALNASLRSVAWIWTLEFLKDSKSFDENFEIVLKNLILHARFINKNLSRREFPNNHLVGEAWGLFILGLFLSPIKESAGYLETTKKILEEEIIKQTYPDGGNKEHAFQYARLSADFFLQAYIIGTKNGIKFSQSYIDRLKKIYDFFLETMTPDYIIPSIGDGEDSVADRLSEVPKRNPTPLLATLSLLFNDEIEDFIEELPVETYFLLGNESFEKFKSIKRTHKIFSSTILPDTGLCIIRSGTLKEGLSLFFDVGPQGLGNSGHGHADSLNVVVYANGRNPVVDPGTYVYNANHDWRNFFKGTSAHNTICVDSLDQAVPYLYTDPFGWIEKADGYLSSWYPGKCYDFASGYHKGYMRLEDGVLHKRSILFNKKQGYWVIFDDLTGSGEHLFELFFHLHPELKVELCQDNSVIGTCEDGSGIKIIPMITEDLKCKIVNGSVDPIQGWFSREYNHKEPSSTIIYSIRQKAPSYFQTIIYPFSGLEEKRRLSDKILDISLIEGINNVNHFHIKHESGITENILTSKLDDKRFVCKNFETDAEILFFSVDRDELIRDVVAINPTKLDLNKKSLLVSNDKYGLFEVIDYNK